MSQTPEHLPDDDLRGLDIDDEVSEDDLRSLRAALTRYRDFAYVTGVTLIVLMCIGMPLKYIGHNASVINWVGMPHGFLYMGLLITAFDLGQRARWTWKRLIVIALAGTVPFLSFVAEYYARKDVLSKLSAWRRLVK